MAQASPQQDQPSSSAAGSPLRFLSSSSRLLHGFLIVILAVGLLRFFVPVVRLHSSAVTADPYTYIGFARTLAKGRISLDHQIADIVRDEAARRAPAGGTASQGPVWNTMVSADGRMLYSVEIGYPLFLAALIRSAGLVVAVYSNFLIIPLLLGLAFYLAWRGLGRGLSGLAAGVAVCLLFPAFDYHTLHQMHYPWREPLFMSLLLGTAGAVLAFADAGRARWLAVAALLFGLACSIKLANLVYAPVLGIFVLVTPAFRRHPGKIRLVLACAAAFLVGLSPALTQNALSSGHPLHSLHVARETREFSAPNRVPVSRWAM
jgi:hypothetical protein